jgi:hypothetical protein
MTDRYDFVEDRTTRAMILLALDFIDSNVLGEIDIHRSTTAPTINRVAVRRDKFSDTSVETFGDDDEYPQEFSPEFVREQMDLGNLRAVNVNRPRPSVVDIETEDE